MKDEYTTDSHYLAYTGPFKGWENVLFEPEKDKHAEPHEHAQ